MFISSYLEVLDKFLYSEKISNFSILANGLAMLLKHFWRKKLNFFILAMLLANVDSF